MIGASQDIGLTAPFHQNRTVSWLMSIPRSANICSTFRSDSGYRTYIITTRRMISGELLKYRNGSCAEANTAGDSREFAVTPPARELVERLCRETVAGGGSASKMADDDLN
jgi:hypothetical protein